MALPLIHLRGTPFEQGLEHGRQLKDRVLHNLEVYFERFEREVGLSRPEVLRRALPYAEAIRTHNEGYFESMRGVAEGAGVGFGDIAALNVRYEIMYYEFGVGEKTGHSRVGIDGCTAFGLLPERMTNGHLVIGQSWDWIPQVKGALLQTEAEDAPSTLAFTEAGIVGGKIGLNSAGLGLCINGLASLVDDWSTLEKPFHVRCFELLRQERLEDAREVVLGSDRPGSANFLIAQTPGQLLDLEVAPKSCHLLEPDGGSVVHTNHFRDPRALGFAEPDDEFYVYSCGREARMQTMLASQARFSLEDLQAVLRDHEGHPNSVCRHEDPDFGPEEHYISVASVLMDLTDGVLWISDGPPCEHPFERHDL